MDIFVVTFLSRQEISSLKNNYTTCFISFYLGISKADAITTQHVKSEVKLFWGEMRSSLSYLRLVMRLISAPCKMDCGCCALSSRKIKREQKGYNKGKKDERVELQCDRDWKQKHISGARGLKMNFLSAWINSKGWMIAELFLAVGETAESVSSAIAIQYRALCCTDHHLCMRQGRKCVDYHLRFLKNALWKHKVCKHQDFSKL